MVKLTKDEKRFLAALVARGSMSTAQAQEFWATPHYVSGKLKRLDSLGLIKMTESGRIIPNGVQKECLDSFLKS